MDSFQYINSGFINTDELLYSINRAGSGEVGSDFKIERSSSYPYCVIHFVVKGWGEVFHRGIKYQVKQGQCFVLNSFESHCYCSMNDSSFHLNWIEFSGGDSLKLINAFLNAFSPVVDESKSRAINKYILRIFMYLKINGKSRSINISKAIYCILTGLLSECTIERSTKLPEPRIGDIQRVMRYIEDNLNESLSLQSLSQIINYNPQYFSKLFRRYTGVTPAKYIMDRRICKAKDELYAGDVQIDLLAERLGFCNASHFIRKFKKAEGLTPAEFRKESFSYYKK